MKKNLLITALIFGILTSIVSGTLAVYTTEIDELAAETNAVIAKSFILTGAGVENFNDTVKIAPTETVTKSFEISNFENSIITETAMDVALTIKFSAGEKAIPNLQIAVEKNGVVLTTGKTDVNGDLTLTVNDHFTLQSIGQTNQYDVVITWVSSENDNQYINGSEYLSVNVVGTQS